MVLQNSFLGRQSRRKVFCVQEPRLVLVCCSKVASFWEEEEETTNEILRSSLFLLLGIKLRPAFFMLTARDECKIVVA